MLKAVRRGRPPADSLLRTVGLQLAQRLLRYRGLAQASYLILVLAQAANAAIPDRPWWLRGVLAASAAVFLWGLFRNRAVTAGARRYVERCAGWPSQA